MSEIGWCYVTSSREFLGLNNVITCAYFSCSGTHSERKVVSYMAYVHRIDMALFGSSILTDFIFVHSLFYIYAIYFSVNFKYSEIFT